MFFAQRVDDFLKIDLENDGEVARWPPEVARYGIAVERAASDLASRKARAEVLQEVLKGIF